MDKVTARFPFANFLAKQTPAKRFAWVYTRDAQFVRSVLLRFGVPTRDVEDLVQEVFVIFWKQLGEINVEVDPRPWLYTVALYRAGNYRRLFRCRKERFALSLVDAPDLGVTELDPGQMMDAYRSFMRLMERLSEKLRDVFIPVVLWGQSIQEVAERLGIPTKTAESRIYLARAVLQRICP